MSYACLTITVKLTTLHGYGWTHMPGEWLTAGHSSLRAGVGQKKPAGQPTKGVVPSPEQLLPVRGPITAAAITVCLALTSSPG